MDSSRLSVSYPSIILCTYNRADLLERALHALTKQSLGQEAFEVVIVDDGSKDRTRQVCEQSRKNLNNLKYVPIDGNRGLGYARNLGVREAGGDYLLFTDDDCIADRSWIEELRGGLGRSPIVSGSVISPTDRYLILCHNIAQFHASMPGRSQTPLRMIAGANMGFRRSVLEELGGFDPSYRIAQDMELILRAYQQGYTILHIPKAKVLHEPRLSGFQEVFRHASVHAAQTVFLRNRYRRLLGTPALFQSPVLLLLFAPLLALKATLDIYRLNKRLIKWFWTCPMVYVLKLVWCWGASTGLRACQKENRARTSTQEVYFDREER